MKKAILAVSFGTACPEAVQSCILPLEDALQAAFPEYTLCRAFASQRIVEKLQSRGVPADDTISALQKLRAAGCTEIIVVPAFVLHGTEYEKTMACAGKLPMSEALLETEDDLIWMAVLLSELAAEEDRPLLMMGHGSDHAADAVYARLQQKLPENVFVACIEGEHSLQNLLPALDKLPQRKLTLMPLMLASGRHAQRDLAGNGENSWKSILQSRGFDVRIRMQGLGSMQKVQKRFVEKARKLLSNV